MTSWVYACGSTLAAALVFWLIVWDVTLMRRQALRRDRLFDQTIRRQNEDQLWILYRDADARLAEWLAGQRENSVSTLDATVRLIPGDAA